MNTHWKKNIILFLAGQTISLFGSSLVQYAIMWHITLSTQSGIMMTISILCGFLPTFFLSPFAGVWADRYPRKTLIILADTMIAVATLILAILYLMGYGSIWLLFFMSAIRALGSGVQSPAISALLPQLVPEDQLTKVNGANTGIQSLVTLLSPILSGTLMSMAPLELIFFIDVITAAIAIAILLLWVAVPPHQRAQATENVGYLDDLKEGFRYIQSHAYIKSFFIFCGFFFIFMAPAAFLTPLQVTRTFGEEVWRLTAIEVVFSVGMMGGGVLIASWGGFRNRAHTMAFAYLVVSLCTVGLGLVPIYYKGVAALGGWLSQFTLYLLFMGIFGIAVPLFNTPATVLLQEKVEPDYLGRIFGVMGMISSSMMPLGMMIFGPLADTFPIEWMLIGTGIALLVQTILFVGNKALVEAGLPK